MIAIALFIAVASIIALYCYLASSLISDRTKSDATAVPVGDWSELLQELRKPCAIVEKISPLGRATGYNVVAVIDGVRVSRIYAGNTIEVVATLAHRFNLLNYEQACATLAATSWNALGQQISSVGRLHSPLHVLQNTFESSKSTLDTCNATL